MAHEELQNIGIFIFGQHGGTVVCNAASQQEDAGFKSSLEPFCVLDFCVTLV